MYVGCGVYGGYIFVLSCVYTRLKTIDHCRTSTVVVDTLDKRKPISASLERNASVACIAHSTKNSVDSTSACCLQVIRCAEHCKYT